MIQRVSENHSKPIDVVVYDAFACNSVWINTCIEVGMDAIVRVKNNNVESIKSIKKTINKSYEIAVWTDIKEFENVKVYEGNFYMKSVEQPLRFVKFLIKKPDGKRSQIMIVTACMNMDLKTLFKIIRVRQDIENSIFHNLKTKCG